MNKQCSIDSNNNGGLHLRGTSLPCNYILPDGCQGVERFLRSHLVFFWGGGVTLLKSFEFLVMIHSTEVSQRCLVPSMTWIRSSIE